MSEMLLAAAEAVYPNDEAMQETLMTLVIDGKIDAVLGDSFTDATRLMLAASRNSGEAIGTIKRAVERALA